MEFVPYKPPSSSETRPLINLLKGWPNPSLLPVDSIRSSAHSALSDPSVIVPGLLYGPDWGYEPLRSSLSDFLTNFYHPQEKIAPERLCVSGGASQNLACILQVYSDPIYTRNIWMVSPTYFLACRIFEDSGFKGRLRSVPEDEEGIDIEFLRREIKASEESAKREGKLEPKIKPPRPWNKIYKHFIYAVPTFSNPSSKTMSLSRREELVQIAREFDALIVTDDVYDQLQWTAKFDSPSTSYPSRAIQPRIVDVDRFFNGGAERTGSDGFGNSVSSGSFSKIVGPGCRTGWAEGTTKFAFGLSQAGSSRSGGAPSQLTATIMSKLVESGELQKHVVETLQPAYATRYSILLAAINKYLSPLGITLPQTDREVVGGYFVWLTLPSSLNADTLAKRAKEENVIIAPGSLFGVYGDTKTGDLENEVRLCFAWEEENLLEEGIQRLSEVVRSMLAETKDGHVQPRPNADEASVDASKYS